MAEENTFEYWHGKAVVDSEGEKIGKIDDLYLDDATEQREWLVVDMGVFGRSVLIPAGDIATLDADTIQVPYTKQQVKDSPHIEPDGELSEQDESDLYEYYGVSFSDKYSPSLLPDAAPPQGGPGETVEQLQTGIDLEPPSGAPEESGPGDQMDSGADEDEGRRRAA